MVEVKDSEGRGVTPSDADLLPVLAALGGAIADTLREQAGPVAFLDTATRFVGRVQPPEPTKTRALIVEP